MYKTPSALKWLAEKRARLANDAEQTTRMAEELRERSLKLQSQLAAVDETIRIYDSAIDPHDIEPVSPQTRYGKRGALKTALVKILEENRTDWVSSLSLEAMLIARFGIRFESAAQRKRWRTNCLCSALKRLQVDGTAEHRRRDDGPREDRKSVV